MEKDSEWCIDAGLARFWHAQIVFNEKTGEIIRVEEACECQCKCCEDCFEIIDISDQLIEEEWDHIKEVVEDWMEEVNEIH